MTLELFGLKKLKITAKLYLGFSVAIIIVVLVSAFGINALFDIKNHTAKNDFANKLSAELDKLRSARLTYLASNDLSVLDKNRQELSRTVDLIENNSKLTWQSDDLPILEGIRKKFVIYQSSYEQVYQKEKERQSMIEGISQETSQAKLDDYYQAIQNTPLTEAQVNKLFNFMLLLSDVRDIAHDVQMHGEQAYVDQASEKIAQAQKMYNSFSHEADLPFNVIDPAWHYFEQFMKNMQSYYHIYQESVQATSVLSESAQSLTQAVQVLNDTEAEKNRSIIFHTISVMIVISILAILFGLLAAWYITRLITKPIKDNLQLAEHIADGDLTQRIQPASNDELGQLTSAMGKMNARLHKMIADIQVSVVHVVDASGKIAASNDDLASRTEQQSAAVVETAASMEELTSAVKRNAENAHQASQLATGATQDAGKGGDIVRGVIKTMDSITDSSKKITEIINVINGISFQTNILALNAAVEAARAGEQGRGFAVVAGEVRMLASRSAQAAKEIETLITESVSRVQTGSSQVYEAGKTMENIFTSVSHVNDIMKEIASASDEQSRGIDQISHAISELDTTTQQNAAMVVDSSHNAGALEEEASRLAGLVEMFRISAATVQHKRAPVRPALPGKPTITGDNSEQWESF